MAFLFFHDDSMMLALNQGIVLFAKVFDLE